MHLSFPLVFTLGSSTGVQVRIGGVQITMVAPPSKRGEVIDFKAGVQKLLRTKRSRVECPTCKGAGLVEPSPRLRNGPRFVSCSSCKGVGWIKRAPLFPDWKKKDRP